MTDAPSPSSKKPRKRTLARELALQYLFQWDLLEGRRIEPGQSAADFCREQVGDDVDVTDYARLLIDSVRGNREAIDAALNDTARNWRLSRMIGVDRTILRIGTCELGWIDGVPPRVAINEAIELAKKYSTDRSSAFVNGILDRIHKRFTEQPPEGDRETAPATGDNG